MRPRFSIALLSEDSSEHTRMGLQAILEKLLRRFEDDGFTRRVEIVPVDAKLRPILIANRWRSTRPRDEAEKRELLRYLARKIAEPGGFVVFHYDGDERWSERAESPARAQFDREIRRRVEQVLSASRMPREVIARHLARLIECVPFYSLEAWTYQATARAIALCREEVCLRDAHNADLGKHVPVWEVVQAGRSMTWFVWSLHAQGELEDALASPP